jgi:hypothetical protein
MSQCVSILSSTSKNTSDPITGKREIATMEQEEYKRRIIEEGLCLGKNMGRMLEKLEKRELIKISKGIVYEAR